jgi:ribonucleoside-diphosphate reductase beta chain
MLAGYDQLLAAARRLRWDAEAIDLRADRAAAATLGAAERALLTELVAGFQVAEHAVADELAPFVAAAGAAGSDPAAAECFAVQAGDEARHARFFDRVGREVLDLDPARAQRSASAALRALFCERLPAAARGLASDARRLAPAVGLYHLVLEGIVFAVGQDALLAFARGEDRTGAPLPGIAEGTARVQQDERWHIGLGVLHLQRLGAPVDVAAQAGPASRAWGPAIATPQRIDRALTAHTRRVRIAESSQCPDAEKRAVQGRA